ncbi:hypothetical protein G3480_24850 [Thiorhodococcus mannitoliphagus]|uniref:Uncharacterized protein n=1 Tax=Thiorhodococcus mannitoliphagus TaxID=329406 RepID=A0A6P1DZ23_9GAMM|nr:hypothetical protein [Thiorhodococcus mannitoliphagus]NEX23478.1 hypothetical protein [Thiorhodococcus mannitoliphagus]
MARFAETFGDQAATLYRIGGDVALKTARRAGELGQEPIKLAATYGQDGLRTLDRIGAVAFVKDSARASKMAYKGDVIRLLARWLMHLPTWTLYALIGLAGAVWLPWRRLRGRSRHLMVPTNAGRHALGHSASPRRWRCRRGVRSPSSVWSCRVSM